MTATIALSGTGYGYLFMGTKSGAEAAEEAAMGELSEAEGVIPEKERKENSEGNVTSWFEIPVESLDKEILFAARGRSLWYQRGIVIKSDGLPVKEIKEEADPDEEPDPVPDTNPPGGNTQNPDNNQGGSASTNGSTAPVDNRTGLADGVYAPDYFSWSGGAGHINILCDQVVIRNGQAYANITITSGYYQYIKAGGGTWYTSHGSGTSTALIPVELNTNQTIIGLTTKLSQPYEIAYSIYVGLNTGNAAGSGTLISENHETLDTKAPVIPGLTGGEEQPVVYTDLFRIFTYDDGYALLEIDISTDTAYAPEAEETDAENAADKEALSEDADAEEASASDAEMKASVYRHAVVKYLIVPENGEVPAGMEKEMAVIRLPLASVCISSEEVLQMLDSLDCLDLVTSACLPEESLQALKQNGREITDAGKAEEPSLRLLVMEETDLVLADSVILPSAGADEERQSEQKETYEDLTSKLAQMRIPYVILRSMDEPNALAKAEWLKVLGLLFDREEEAVRLYEETVGTASESEKEAALASLTLRRERNTAAAEQTGS